MSLPARLIVDQFQPQPSPVTGGTQSFVFRVHVTSTCGGAGARARIVYAHADAVQPVRRDAEQRPVPSGWAIADRSAGQANFPVNGKQQILAMVSGADPGFSQRTCTRAARPARAGPSPGPLLAGRRGILPLVTHRQPDPAPGADPERGFVVAVLPKGADPGEELAEIRELARTAGVEPVATLVQPRAAPGPGAPTSARASSRS